MSPIITFSSFKDGIGKTVLSSHLAYLLNQFGYNVVLIDTDWRLHELTKKLCGYLAVLKPPKYQLQFFRTSDKLANTNEIDKLEWYNLLTAILTQQQNKQGRFWQFWTQARENSLHTKIPSTPEATSLASGYPNWTSPWFYLLPSYYCDPVPFWKYLSLPYLENLQQILLYYKKMADFVIIDTTTFDQMLLEKLYRLSDQIVWLMSYGISSIQDNQEYYTYLADTYKAKIWLLTNIIPHRLAGEELTLSLCKPLMELEQQRCTIENHKQQFLWDMYPTYLPNSVCVWTIELFRLARAILLEHFKTQNNAISQNIFPTVQQFTVYINNLSLLKNHHSLIVATT